MGNHVGAGPLASPLFPWIHTNIRRAAEDGGPYFCDWRKQP